MVATDPTGLPEHGAVRCCPTPAAQYHLGESGASASLARSKAKFGAEPLDYAELRLERLPYTRVDRVVRSVAKRALRFRDV